MYIDRLSICAVHLTFKAATDAALGTGTGFIVQAPNGPLLLTARHCVTGRFQAGSQPIHKSGAIPYSVLIRHHAGTSSLVGLLDEQPLYDEDKKPRWLHHPRYNCLTDIAALPITIPKGAITEPIELDDEEDYVLRYRVAPAVPAPRTLRLLPAEAVSVVGYPFGNSTASTLPIWATGFIASEPGSNWEWGDMLIDCRARPGHSGSPVFAKRFGQLITGEGQHIEFEGVADCFVGLYVGRINEQSDFGVVYKPSTLRNLVNAGVPGHDCFWQKTANCRPLELP